MRIHQLTIWILIWESFRFARSPDKGVEFLQAIFIELIFLWIKYYNHSKCKLNSYGSDDILEESVNAFFFTRSGTTWLKIEVKGEVMSGGETQIHFAETK